jgi:hypothetical protein
MRISVLWLVLCCAVAACRPNTTRPPFTPLPEAAGTEVRLPVRDATRRLAELLRADSVPLRRVSTLDGYMESGWFDVRTRRPSGNRRAIGPGFVRIRAWADPSRPGSSQLTVETLYRPLVDPSLPERELEREVPRNHPIAVKVEAALRQMVTQYGGAPAATEADGAAETDAQPQ